MSESPVSEPPVWFDLVARLRDELEELSAPGQRELLASLPDDVQRRLATEWRFTARPAQLEAADPPDGADGTSAKTITLALAGRGWGKTFVGASWVTELVRYHGYRRLALVSETAADARDVMIEGESGILALAPADFRPVYEPSKRRVTWPNGAVATAYASESYEALRGPSHDAAWVDELAKFRYARETWDQLEMTLRIPDRPPRVLVTTTPRPTALIRELLADADVHTVRGSTYDNRAHLSPKFLARIEKRYAGTRLGRQELYAEVLDDVVGALWTWAMVAGARTRVDPDALSQKTLAERGWHAAVVEALGLHRVVVAVDPAVTANADSDRTGIIIAGCTRDLERGVVLDDLSGIYTPNEWALVVKSAVATWGADCVVAERNQGGDLVAANLRSVDRSLRIKTVHAYRGKALRAEPVAGLYEQGRVGHLVQRIPDPQRPGAAGAETEVLAGLEATMTEWVPGIGPSPDALDAAVYAVTELMLPEEAPRRGRASLI